MVVGAPAPIWTVEETTPERPAALKPMVRAPGVPAIARSVNGAAPLARETTLVVPSSVPVPVARTAPTVIPPWATGLPAESCTCTTGCWAKGRPLAPEADGWVSRPSRAAAPGVSTMTAEVSGVRPVDATAIR
jgi:hypothetical protein